MYTYFIYASQSGVKQLQVHPSAGSWRNVLNGVGSGKHTFQLADDETFLPGSTWRGLVAKWSRTLVVCWNDVPVYAGLIVKHRFDEDSGVLQIDHVTLRSILARRFPFMVPTFTPEGVFFAMDRTLRAIARAIIGRAFLSVPGDNYHFPVRFGADEAGTHSRSWPHYLFRRAEDLLTEIQDTDGGPDIDLRPEISSGLLRWECRIGSPQLDGAVSDWYLNAPESSVTGFHEIEDGVEQRSGIFVIGAGSEVDMKVGSDGAMPGSAIPDMDTSISAKSIREIPELDGLARGELRATREPVTQYGFDTLTTEVDVAQFVVGSTARVYAQGSRLLPDGWNEFYLIGVGGDVAEKMTLEIQ